MLVKISNEEAIYVTTAMLREAYIACVKASRSTRTHSEERERYVDMSVGFPIVLRYFLNPEDYFDFMEKAEEDLND